jgi:hypothetical protein
MGGLSFFYVLWMLPLVLGRGGEKDDGLLNILFPNRQVGGQAEASCWECDHLGEGTELRQK